mgnify:CR=1 FL=1
MCDSSFGCTQTCKQQENCLHFDAYDEKNHFGRTGNDVWSTIEWDANQKKTVQNSCVNIDWGCNSRTTLDGGKQFKFSYAGGDTVLNCKTWNKNTKTASFGQWKQKGDAAVCIAKEEEPPSCPEPEMVGYWKMIAPVSSGGSVNISVGTSSTTSTANSKQITSSISRAFTTGWKFADSALSGSTTTTASVSAQTAETMSQSATESLSVATSVSPPSHYEKEQTAYLWQWYFDLNQQKKDMPAWCPKQTTATNYTAWTPDASQAPVCPPDTVCVAQGLSACHHGNVMFPKQKPIPYQPPPDNPTQKTCWQSFH